MPIEARTIPANRLERFIKLATQGIWTVDANNLTDFINDFGASIIGYRPEEMLGRPVTDFVYPESKEVAEGQLRDRKEGRVQQDQFRLCHRDGHEVWISFTASPMYDEQGNYEGAISIFSDVTEHRLMGAALMESRQDLNLAQSVSKTGSWRINVDTNKLLWSDETYRIFDISIGTPMTYERFLKLVHPDDRKFLDDKWQAALLNEGYDIEHRIVVNGEVRWVREKAILEFKDNELRSGFGTVQDITERKQVEEECALLASFPQLNPSPVVELTPDGAILYSNPTARATFPDLEKMGFDHPFLAGSQEGIGDLLIGRGPTFVREVRAGQSWFQQQFIFVPESSRIRIYSIRIDAMKEAELALQESEAKYKSLFENMNEGFLLLNLIRSKDGKVSDAVLLNANPAYEKQTGFSVRNLIGKKMRQYFHESEQQWWGTYGEVEETGVPKRVDGFNKDTGRYYEAYCFKFAEGQIGIVFRDTTKSMNAEATLRESEGRFRTMADGSPVIIWVTDSVGGLQFANRKYREFFGVSFDKVEKGKWQPLVHPDDSSAYKGAFSLSLHERKSFYAKARVRQADGAWRWIESRAEPRFAGNGEFLGFVGISSDITERKKAEEALNESEERFRTLADNIPTLCWMANADGWIFWYNRRWYEYTGTTPEQMEGWGWQSVHDPEALPKVLDRWKGSIATGLSFDMVFPLRGADGVFRPFLTRISPVKDDHGKVVRWFGTNTDITEELERQRELERSNAELAQFAYVASHDLQEPLRMVTVYLQLLNKKFGDDLSPQAKEYMRTAVSGSERMRQLINDLLQYSRVDTDGKERTLVNLTAVAEKIKEDLHIAINEAKAKVTIEQLPTVLADGAQMAQLLQNLMSNAVKFHSKEEPPRIIVFAQRGYHKWIIAVKDNGIGIDPKYKDNLFKMFQRLHTQEEYPGTGIGLAISKKIVEQHGGMIWFESEPGKGSTFYFTIPEISELAQGADKW